WLRHISLKDQFSSFHRIALNHQAFVAEVMTTVPPNIVFMRNIVRAKLFVWEEPCAKLATVQLVDQADSFFWVLSSSGSYSVNSFYQFMINTDSQFRHKII
ncbi:hypothetical protein BRADI_4g17226v3, partial [Brachypodium distachyon]